jgi:hypothetical protein
MTSAVHLKISVRAWSDFMSFKPLAKQLGARTSTVYDKGELTFSGRVTGRTSCDNYLATNDIKIEGVTDLNRTVREQIDFIMADAVLAPLTRGGDGRVYVWIAVFGHDPRETETLGLDMRPFGHGIGLIVDNFTTFNEAGQPKLLEIKPTAG